MKAEHNKLLKDFRNLQGLILHHQSLVEKGAHENSIAYYSYNLRLIEKALTRLKEQMVMLLFFTRLTNKNKAKLLQAFKLNRARARFVAFSQKLPKAKIKSFLDKKGYVIVCMMFALMIFPQKDELKLLLKGSLKGYRALAFIVDNPKRRTRGLKIFVGINLVGNLLEGLLPDFASSCMLEITHLIEGVRVVASTYVICSYKLASYIVPEQARFVFSPIIDYLAQPKVAAGVATLPLARYTKDFYDFKEKNQFLDQVVDALEQGRTQANVVGHLVEGDEICLTIDTTSLVKDFTNGIKNNVHVKFIDTLRYGKDANIRYVNKCIKIEQWLIELNQAKARKFPIQAEVFETLVKGIEEIQSNSVYRLGVYKPERVYD